MDRDPGAAHAQAPAAPAPRLRAGPARSSAAHGAAQPGLWRPAAGSGVPGAAPRVAAPGPDHRRQPLDERVQLFFLRFARGLIDVFPHADAFVFHTRLTHATDTLRERDSHRLKEKIAWIAAGWGGGTRIGESLQTFNRDFARRRVDSRTWVFILSDGYDTGEPELLGEQLRRLRQRARA
jgi:hypothetical protein